MVAATEFTFKLWGGWGPLDFVQTNMYNISGGGGWSRGALSKKMPKLVYFLEGLVNSLFQYTHKGPVLKKTAPLRTV